MKKSNKIKLRLKDVLPYIMGDYAISIGDNKGNIISSNKLDVRFNNRYIRSISGTDEGIRIVIENAKDNYFTTNQAATILSCHYLTIRKYITEKYVIPKTISGAHYLSEEQIQKIAERIGRTANFSNLEK